MRLSTSYRSNQLFRFALRYHNYIFTVLFEHSARTDEELIGKGAHRRDSHKNQNPGPQIPKRKKLTFLAFCVYFSASCISSLARPTKIAVSDTLFSILSTNSPYLCRIRGSNCEDIRDRDGIGQRKMALKRHR